MICCWRLIAALVLQTLARIRSKHMDYEQIKCDPHVMFNSCCDALIPFLEWEDYIVDYLEAHLSLSAASTHPVAPAAAAAQASSKRRNSKPHVTAQSSAAPKKGFLSKAPAVQSPPQVTSSGSGEHGQAGEEDHSSSHTAGNPAAAATVTSPSRPKSLSMFCSHSPSTWRARCGSCVLAWSNHRLYNGRH